MICPRCQTPNSDTDKFCEQCGAPLPQRPPQPAQVDDSLSGPTMIAGPTGPAFLVPVHGDGAGPTELSNRCIVGRLDSCDVTVDDKSVSREHARLSRLRDGYVIEDLGSTNGTLVNGQRIHEAVLLRPGDVVTFGSVDYRYEVEGQPSPAGPDVGPPPFSDQAATSIMQAHPSAMPPFPGEPAGSGRADRPLDNPTMSDLPSVDMSFPPFEPFGAMKDEVEGPPLGPSEPPQAPPPRVDKPEARPAPEPVAAAQSRSEPPPSPFERDSSPWARPDDSFLSAFPDAQAAGTPPPQESRLPEQQSSGPVGGFGGTPAGDRAVALARELNDVVRDVARQLSETAATSYRMQERIAELEKVNRKQEAARSHLQQAPEPSVTRGQIQAMQDMLDTLIHSPRDVGVLMQFGEQAASLAAVVNEYTQLRKALIKAASELDASPPG
ncbi:MAG: FHA domain-containing protein [Chloroflexi bacterium]|nr:FHA domain-containing protein [Chloroflexota bacterium]